MPNCKTVVPYRGSPEQEERLRQVIAEHRGQPGATMPVLQAAQEIFGYLPEEVQIMVAEGLDIPLSEVYGVASFYAQFSMNPKGKYQISVCLGTACYVKGAAAVLNAVEQKLGIVPGAITPDGKFSLDSCRCVGACGLAPVMMINNDVYGRLTPDQVGPILDMYKEKRGAPGSRATANCADRKTGWPQASGMFGGAVSSCPSRRARSVTEKRVG